LPTYGIVIVSPAMRERGLGRRLMDHLISANGGRSILLNSTEEGHRLYEAFGFRDIGTVHQHQAWIPANPARMPVSGNDRQVRAAGPDDMPAIQGVDQRAFGAMRTSMLTEFDRIGIAAVIEGADAVERFAMCRPFGLGQTIGPVVARSAGDARSLIRRFLQAQAGEFLRIDIEGDSGLGAWLSAQGLPDVGAVTTMVRGTRPPTTGPKRIYGMLAGKSAGDWPELGSRVGKRPC
jgi:hypothetical protein